MAKCSSSALSGGGWLGREESGVELLRGLNSLVNGGTTGETLGTGAITGREMSAAECSRENKMQDAERSKSEGMLGDGDV